VEKSKVEVTFIKVCKHDGKDKKVGDKVYVTKGQSETMRSHGLVDKS
tara:strand:- start:427 stop:567 length:141 start_codon:yes stop_codon:yes gene_type:complete